MERTYFLEKCSILEMWKKAPTGQEFTQPVYYVHKLIYYPRKCIFVFYLSANIISLIVLAHNYSILALIAKL